MTTALFCAIVAVTNTMGTVAVDTHGARVVSYVPVGGEEVFFASKTGTGGMPLCWPWFAGLGPEGARRHGIARYHDFKVVGTNRHSLADSELILRLESDSDTRREFPHDFALTVSVRLTDRLVVSMTGENTGDSPFEVTEAMHPYFAVADSRRCRVDGVDSPEYALVDPVGGRTLSFSDAGGAAARHVWRPDANSHLSKTVTPISDDDWMRFLCVENGRFKKKDAIVLQPGDRHTLSRTIRLSMTYANARPIDLQSRIDAAAEKGGGCVVVPPGEWLSEKAIQLRSNVELHLSEGAVLTFPDDPEACLPEVRTSFSGIEYYGLSSLVHAYGATNVAVTGKGTIAPRMAFWREWFNRDKDSFESMGRLYAWGEGDTPVEERRFGNLRTVRLRPSCIEFERCGNVRLEGFHIRESPLWCVHLRLCENVTVRGVEIRARGANNDGIDINASKNVLVENCVLDQGDDGFVIKSGRDRDGRRVGVPCENVEIRNCVIKGGHTLLAVGSEVSGGIRNISLHDCVVEGSLEQQLASIKTSDRKGAFIENVSVSNVTVRGSVGHVAAVRTNVDYQWKRYPARERIVTRIEGFRVENVRADSAQCVYHLSGDARLPVKDVTLKNIHVENSLQASSAENVEGLVVQDVQEPNSCVAVAATPIVVETVLPVCTGWRFHRGDKPGAEGLGISGVGTSGTSGVGPLEMCNF